MDIWNPFYFGATCLGLTHLMDQQTTLLELTDHFDTTGFQLEEHENVFEEGTLYYVIYDDSTKSPLLLIHGSPEDWSACKRNDGLT